MTEISNSGITGKLIVAQDGRKLGVVQSVTVDTSSWTVPEISARVRKDVLDELSLKRPWLGSQSIRISTELVGSVSDSVILSVPLSQLEFSGGKRAERPEERGPGPEGGQPVKPEETTQPAVS